MSLRPPATAQTEFGQTLEGELEWMQTRSEFESLRQELETLRAMLRILSGAGAMRMVQARLSALSDSPLVDQPFRDASFALAEEIALYGFTDEAHRLFIKLYQEYRRLWHNARLKHRENL